MSLNGEPHSQPKHSRFDSFEEKPTLGIGRCDCVEVKQLLKVEVLIVGWSPGLFYQILF